MNALQSKTVIIVGGGVSGLAAARFLAHRGVTPMLLEAKERMGGRIHTLLHGGLPIELGAEFIHGRSQSLLQAIADARLTADKVRDHQQQWSGGKFQTTELWGEIAEVMGRIDGNAPDESFADFMGHSNFPDSVRKLAMGFVQGFDAADPKRISVQALLKAENSANQMEGSWQGRVREGYGALIDYLAAEDVRQGGTIVKNCLVDRIDWKKGSVQVRAVTNGEAATHMAAAAIVTVSLGVLKAGQIRFEPDLPKKREAIDQLEFGNVIKCVMVFRRRWWQPSVDGFILAPDEQFPTWWDDPRGPVLTAWVGGPRADVLRQESSEQLKAICIDILARIFSEQPELIRQQLAEFHYHDWAEDPHILGAYSYIPVNGLDLPKLLAAPVEGTLFFAGEATVTDAQMGTVFGALESGERAAKEVLEAIATV